MKDINGIEIYEGDTVLGWWTADSLEPHEDVVVFEGGAFRLGKSETSREYNFTLADYSELKVIKNK